MKLFTSCLACFLCFITLVSNAQIIDLGVAVFDEPNFEGRHTFFSEDREYETSFGIESIRIPPGWVVTVFTEIEYQGSQKTLNESGNFGDSLKDKIKSIRIDKKNGLNAQYSTRELKRVSVEGYVTLFGSRGFKSTYARIKTDWVFGGWYGIESISVPEGWEIWLYQNKLFEGSHLTLTSSWDGHDPALDDWRDKIKSIRVVRKTAVPPMPITGSLTSIHLSSTGNMVLFEEPGFRGEHIFVHQDWNTEYPIGVESIQIPYGWEVWAYEYNNFQGDYKRLTHSWDGKNGYDDYLWKNNIRSIRIVRKTPIRVVEYISPHIEIFDQPGLQGNSCTISGNWSAHYSGNQSWDNSISSLKIPSGVRVVVYENTGFTGRSFTLTSTSSGALSDFWNDQIGSIQIFCTD